MKKMHHKLEVEKHWHKQEMLNMMTNNWLCWSFFSHFSNNGKEASNNASLHHASACLHSALPIDKNY